MLTSGVHQHTGKNVKMNVQITTGNSYRLPTNHILWRKFESWAKINRNSSRSVDRNSRIIHTRRYIRKSSAQTFSIAIERYLELVMILRNINLMTQKVESEISFPPLVNKAHLNQPIVVSNDL